METDIYVLKEDLIKMAERASSAEKGWRSLEETFTVRQARRLGLVRAKPPDSDERPGR